MRQCCDGVSAEACALNQAKNYGNISPQIMKNYILALMLIPLLLHGQKFRDSEVKFTKDGGGKRASKTAVMERVPRLLSYQGFLTVGNAGPVSDGQYTVNFRLFGEEEGGKKKSKAHAPSSIVFKEHIAF